MKILYGVQGTGNGHIARARIMAAALAQYSNIQVDYVFSGRDPKDYFDMDIFGQYQTFDGLSFVSNKGRVNKWHTLLQAKPKQLISDIKQLDVSQYDLLINDFEPVTAWAAKNHGLPSISISHQAAFTYSVPKAGNTLTDRIIMQSFAPTDLQLGVHWFHFNSPILPPFISDKPTPSPSHSHFIVYLPFEDVQEIYDMLSPLTEHQFACFHPAIKTPSQDKNIHWYPPSKTHFQTSLQHCAGVIGNGGFELSSEALQLGKKLLLKPLHGQFEQLSNVITLYKMGLCQPLYRLDTDTVEDWLIAPDNEAIEFPDNPSPLIDWIVAGNWSNPKPLCDELWNRVKFGSKTRERLMSLAF